MSGKLSDNEMTSVIDTIEQTMNKIMRLGTPKEYVDIYREKMNDLLKNDNQERVDLVNDHLAQIRAVEENIRTTEKHKMGNTGTPKENIENYKEITRNIFINADCTREGANSAIGTLHRINQIENNIKSTMEGLVHGGLPEERASIYALEMREMITDNKDSKEIRNTLSAIRNAENTIIQGIKDLRTMGVLNEDDLNGYATEMRGIIDNADKYDQDMMNAVKNASSTIIHNKEYAIDTQKEEAEPLFYATIGNAMTAIRDLFGTPLESPPPMADANTNTPSMFVKK